MGECVVFVIGAIVDRFWFFFYYCCCVCCGLDRMKEREWE